MYLIIPKGAQKHTMAVSR